MPMTDAAQKYLDEIAALKEKLNEYEETLSAIRNGEVDALVVAGRAGEQVYTLKGAEHPYRAFIENMNEGAVTLNPEGVILYCNPRFGALMEQPVQTLIGRSVLDMAAAPQDRATLKKLLGGRLGDNRQAEIAFRSSDVTTFPAKISVSGLNIEEALTFCMVVTDLTERRQKEEFRALAENSPDVIVRVNRQLRVVYANPAAAAAYGGTIVGTLVSELNGFPGEIAQLARRACETAETMQLVFQYTAPKEERCFYDARIVPELNDKGKVVSSLIIARDITRLKETEQHLYVAVTEAKTRAEQAEEGRKILETLMQNIQEGIMITDAEGKVRGVSDYLARIAGVRAQDVIGGNMDVIDARLGEPEASGFAPAGYPMVRALKRGETTLSEERVVRSPDGADITVLINASPIFSREGKIIGGLTSWRDITERKKAEDTLRRNEYELRTLVDNSPDIIFRLNRQLQYVYVNPAYERITGITKERFAGKTNSQLGMPQRMAEFWQSTAQSAIEGGREHSAEFDMTSFFGTRYFFARIIPEFAKSGLVETVLVIARDITERRRSEEQIRYISFHDEVTGLFNRAFFEEELRRVDTDRDLPVSIIMGDINNLKLTNDVFGHGEGDKLLKAIADSIRRASRKSDIVARWGGDEFAVILPKTGYADAEELCRRIEENARESKGTVLRPSIALGAATKEDRDRSIYQTIRKAEEAMYENKMARSGENAGNVISSLVARVREKTGDLTRHIEESCSLARRFGAALELDEGRMNDLLLLVQMHDIGTAAIPREVLAKPGGLSSGEWELVKKHPEAGLRIVKSFPETAKISDEILSHDEHWDGSGYPRGLKGRQIPYLSRIFAVIEAYDVMTHARPYARALTREEAIEELLRNAGKQFDPELVNLFVDKVITESAFQNEALSKSRAWDEYRNRGVQSKGIT